MVSKIIGSGDPFLVLLGVIFGILAKRAQDGARVAQEGAKMGPRGPSRASKTRKAAFAKTLKNNMFFKVFGVQRPPKRALGGPRRLPRHTQRPPQPNRKVIQKWTSNLSIFGPISEPFWGPFWGQNWLQNGTKNRITFGTLSAGSQGSEKCENGK